MAEYVGYGAMESYLMYLSAARAELSVWPLLEVIEAPGHHLQQISRDDIQQVLRKCNFLPFKEIMTDR